MTQTTIGIVGSGIVGSTAAYYLARAGYEVTVFDEGIGQATSASAGIICPWFTLRRNKPWYFLVSNGAEFYRDMMQDLQADGFDTSDIFQQDGALIMRDKENRIERDLTDGALKRETAPSIGHIETVRNEKLSDYFPLLTTDYDATFVEGGARINGRALVQTLQAAIEHFGGKLLRERAKTSFDAKGAVALSSPSLREQSFDRILLSAGPQLPSLLEPLGYEVDVTAHKGQLLSFYSEEWVDKHWPVIMLPGKLDLIPFNNGEIVVGATHEADMGYDLNFDEERLATLRSQAEAWLPAIKDMSVHRREVGSRAYTPDSAVLVGQVPNLSNVWAVSGLGASGLTSGPFLGHQWTQLVQNGDWRIKAEDFPIEQYIRLKSDTLNT